jgi:hypothetical protein
MPMMMAVSQYENDVICVSFVERNPLWPPVVFTGWSLRAGAHVQDVSLLNGRW